MTYSAFRDSDYTHLRKNLLRAKGKRLQREFLEITRNSDTFISWIEQYPVSEDKGASFDLLLTEPLTESDYKEPTKFTEKVLFKRWKNLTPAQASEETFWGYVTLEHIKEGIIQAPYLAANGGNLPGGLERIDKALKENQEQTIDTIVRTILRRLGGLPEARGSKSVYANCPFARAWWRGYVTEEICKETNADYDKVVKTLTVTSTYWEELIVLIVSRNSVLGDNNVRTALIWALSELVEGKDEDKNKNKKQLFQPKGIRIISRQIGIRSAWQELGVFSIEDLKQIMERQFLSQFAA
ncbi:MAG: hypothetical protein OXF05_01300 [Hyphomicrobiales bacterium]|nr:hypothetical protein [Hyphomicrobiales bacterium]MCY4038630.1 hypothetical protein [Hyphomicrobiales bacterium]